MTFLHCIRISSFGQASLTSSPSVIQGGVKDSGLQSSGELFSGGMNAVVSGNQMDKSGIKTAVCNFYKRQIFLHICETVTVL